MDISKDIKELGMAAGVADTFHGRDCCSALDRLENYIKSLRLENDELQAKLDKARNALSFYADKETYIYQLTAKNPAIVNDKGQRARTTLEEIM